MATALGSQRSLSAQLAWSPEAAGCVQKSSELPFTWAEKLLSLRSLGLRLLGGEAGVITSTQGHDLQRSLPPGHEQGSSPTWKTENPSKCCWD